MSNFLFCVDVDSWDRRKDLLENIWINELVDLSLENFDCLNILKRLFSTCEKESYKKLLVYFKSIYSFSFLDVVDSCFEKLFNSNIPISHFRGVFLEVFIYKFCLKFFQPSNIIREFNIKYGENIVNCEDEDDLNCRKTVMDIGIIPLGHAFECKFSPYNLKTKDLDVLICINRKTKGMVKPFLIIFDRKYKFYQKIEKINKEKSTNYTNIDKNVNLIFIDEFNNLESRIF